MKTTATILTLALCCFMSCRAIDYRISIKSDYMKVYDKKGRLVHEGKFDPANPVLEDVICDDNL